MRERRNVFIRGFVHGVGFREKVRRIALCHEVGGFVRNVGSDLVEIDVEGEADVLNAFLDEVAARPPRHARVAGITSTPLEPKGEEWFGIAPSVPG